MPTYKYVPEVGDPISSFVREGLTVYKDEEFEVDNYFSEYVKAKEHYEFVEDKPYISPIIKSYYGAGPAELELDEDIGTNIDILVNVPSGGQVKVYFNGDEISADKYIVAMGCGTILNSVNTSKIRLVNAKLLSGSNFSIAIVPANEFCPSNNY